MFLQLEYFTAVMKSLLSLTLQVSVQYAHSFKFPSVQFSKLVLLLTGSEISIVLYVIFIKIILI